MGTDGRGGEEEGSAAQRVRLAGEKETLLITLYAKALDSRSSHPILGDRKADEMVRSIDYDFERLRGFGNVMVARARQLDEWVRKFLASSSDAVVLNLGCGLDTRISRIDPPAGVAWFDVDYPDVIEVRRRFFSDREGYRMLGSSVTDRGWLEVVPRGRPTMAVAEGLLEYLTQEDVRGLLNGLTERFDRGQVAFDVMSSFAVASGRSRLKERTGAEHRWAVDDVRIVDGLDRGLRRISNLAVVRSRYLPTGYRVAFGAFSAIPRFRDTMRLLRYEISPRDGKGGRGRVEGGAGAGDP
ncbi:MAG: class I SAM-dependent methyltransferase [Nitrososphaerales archaeon]